MKKLCALLVLAPLACVGQEQLPECPRTLEVKSTAPVPAGWQVISPADPNVLERVEFYAGHPSGGAALVPDKSLTKGGDSMDMWRFSSGAPEEPWLACSYTGTALLVARPVAKGAERCEVHYKVTQKGVRLSVTAVRCS